jgi:phage terminase Nu1 subunit (DNA packaging protein)
MSKTSFAVAEIATTDERDYDNWLATLTQATERLDELQSVVAELRQLCEQGDVVQSRQVMEVLETHGAIAKAPKDAA